MITSAENRPWSDDFEIIDLDLAGLPAPSVVCPAKIATIESRHAEFLGRIAPDAMSTVTSVLRRYLGPDV